MKTISSVMFACALASQLGNTDCNGNALKDPGFDLWCGDQLCAWKTERGAVARVPSWNEGDPAVELVGTDVAIEQLSPVDSHDGACLEFTMIANIDESADVELRVDVLGDGSVEHTERVPTSHWKPLTFDLPIRLPYAGVRFELAKTGDGRAVLADIGARVVDGGCGGLDPIVAGAASLGAPCAADVDCKSGICGTTASVPPFQTALAVCIGCDVGHPCGSGEVCGVDVPTSPVRAVPTTCVAVGSHELGDQCSVGTECASGICAYDVCSTCDPAAAASCPSGQTCAPDWPMTTVFGFTFSPYVCAPGLHLHGHGEPCASDDDCASSSCGGAVRRQCADGRACANDLDCPFGDGAVNDLVNGPCTPVGIQGGSCQ